MSDAAQAVFNEIAALSAAIDSAIEQRNAKLDEWAKLVGPKVGATIAVKGEKWAQGRVVEAVGALDPLGRLYVSVAYLPINKDGSTSRRHGRRWKRIDPC